MSERAEDAPVAFGMAAAAEEASRGEYSGRTFLVSVLAIYAVIIAVIYGVVTAVF